MGKHNIANRQAGAVSIMVTMIMMIVITLIVVGFTQVAQRTQREALDDQLAAQALYAAESGVNKVVADAKTQMLAGADITKQDTCVGPYNNSGTGFKNTPAAGSVVSVPCIDVRTNPDKIEFSANTQRATIVNLDPSQENENNLTLKKLTISWQKSPGSTYVANSCGTNFTSLPPTLGSCVYGLMRVDIFQYQDLNTNVNTMRENSTTLYLRPVSSGESAISYAHLENQPPQIYGVKCDATACNADIDFTAGSATKRYYLRITMLYRDSQKVTIDGVGASGDDAFFRNSQLIIESTGKAQDVLKRVQARYPIGVWTADAPKDAIQSKDSICKKFVVYPGFASPNQCGT